VWFMSQLMARWLWRVAVHLSAAENSAAAAGGRSRWGGGVKRRINADGIDSEKRLMASVVAGASGADHGLSREAQSPQHGTSDGANGMTQAGAPVSHA